MAKKRRRAKKKVKTKPKIDLKAKTRERTEQRKQIWNNIDLSNLYREIKDFRGEIVPLGSWLYLVTPYYVCRIDDLAKKDLLKKIGVAMNVTCKYQYNNGKWFKLGAALEDEYTTMLDMFEKGKSVQYDIFPLDLYVAVEENSGEEEENKKLKFHDVEIVSLLNKTNDKFEYLGFVGVNRRISYWLHSGMIFKSDNEYIYGYDGWGYPIIYLPIEKDLVRPIDLKLWSNIFSWSAELKQEKGE